MARLDHLKNSKYDTLYNDGSWYLRHWAGRKPPIPELDYWLLHCCEKSKSASSENSTRSTRRVGIVGPDVLKLYKGCII